MSTYFYLTCEDHDPPLIAPDESGQHWYDLPRIRAEIADRGTVAAEEPYTYDYVRDVDARLYFRDHSRQFLREHPRCRIGIVSEYNEHLDPAACLYCGEAWRTGDPRDLCDACTHLAARRARHDN